MVNLKAEVNANGVTKELYFGLGVCNAIHRQLFKADMVITSLCDGVHNPGSLHPKGQAADLRTMNLTEKQILDWFNAIKAALPEGFDVVLEGPGATPKTTGKHIHIEWDPKGATSLFVRI